MQLLRKFLLLTSLVFFSTSILSGEEGLTPEKNKSLYGIGARVSLSSSTNSTVYFPIITSPDFQYEPEFQHQKNTISETISSGNSALSSQEYISEWISAGVGLIKRRKKDNVSINSGIRVGLIRSTQYNYSGNETTDMAGWGYYIAPMLAGEYYITPSLSLSGEAQYRFTTVKLTGKTSFYSTSGTSSNEITKDETALSSKFLFILRWYFPSGLTL